MFTKLFIENIINNLIIDLIEFGYHPSKVYLFGSYPKGCATDNSDIDIAIWSPEFTGIRILDIQKISSIISKYSCIEIHTFTSNQEENDFIKDIYQTGIDYTLLITSLPDFKNSIKI